MYLSLVQCEGTARAGTVLCEECHWRYDDGKGHPDKAKRVEPPWTRPGKKPRFDWQGWLCELHPESHILGSKWWRDKYQAMMATVS
jgi:hypothetical protein